jgi:hypothetical protein
VRDQDKLVIAQVELLENECGVSDLVSDGGLEVFLKERHDTDGEKQECRLIQGRGLSDKFEEVKRRERLYTQRAGRTLRMEHTLYPGYRSR